ncbi:DUF3667 domain-containing protein [Hymenobacter sp. CRA2]|uniref:DUF3667 domain-containing protein n=1 Tax=Hymenobacter sp. CRA2 TaxID=1955620 RepID=UPI00098F1A76|nr:DUF3667 domain-containing protein [Hymenobacter sp. CRA2]OON69679.1 hypothetical protein B0919_07035 [Hymenobacter sp. CRA2]
MTSSCKNCGAPLYGRYCHVCGQKQILPQERQLHYIAGEFFHYFTHLDSKFLSSLKSLFTQPGLMTQDAIQGITVRHFKLSSLFLIGTLLYFLIPNNYLISSNMVTSYRQEVQGGGVGKFKREIAAGKMQKQRLTEQEVAGSYDKRKHAYGKLLTFLLIPLTIPVLWLVTLASTRFKGSYRLTAFDMGIASLELNSLIIIGFFTFASLLTSSVYLVFASETLFISVVAACLLMVLYLLQRFFKRVLQLTNGQGLLALIIFLGGYAGVLVVYGIVAFVVFI